MTSQLIKYGDDRVLSPKMSLFDLVSVIGNRINQLEGGLPAFIEGDYDPEVLAIKEIEQKKCPLSILRAAGEKNGIKIVEMWEVNEMVVFLDELVN
jgi:DNA-directed RNA polymerase subunit K/omega